MKRNVSIDSVLSPLMEKPTQAYLSNILQTADILEWILQQFGRSEIWQTSFSISEEFIRRLYFIEKSGNVKSFHLILDHKATNKTLHLWNFIKNVIDDTHLADNHSKLILVRSEHGNTASVITSQNLTRGNRYESSIITTDKAIFAELLGQMKDLMTNHSVPLSDLLANKINS